MHNFGPFPLNDGSCLPIVRKSLFYIITLSLLLWYIVCLPDQLFNAPYSTVANDRHGELIGARIADDGQWRFPPVYTISEKYTTCLIQFEDRRFKHHWGVDPVAMARATVQNIKAGKVISGGSTITMQTVRLMRKKTRTFGEKFIEMVWATRLEFRYSKERILALYASHAPFGGNVVGLEAASWRYFGHASNHLSWAEAATLAVLPNAPSVNHLSKNRKGLVEKRNRLLKKLLEKSIIDVSTYELALSETLPDEPQPLPQIAPHLVAWLYNNHRGENFSTTIDKGLQQQVEHVLLRWSEEFSRNDIRNLAAMVIDIESNQVLVYCGNVLFNSEQSANQVDVVRAPRSTGSILKPLLYCIMLQEGELLPHLLIADVPINVNGFTPQNFDLKFSGAVPASEALARSLNVPAVNELRQFSVPRFYDFLKKAGLTTLNKTPAHYGLSLILGGAEATLWDVAAAYGDMAKTLLGTGQQGDRYILGKPKLWIKRTQETAKPKKAKALPTQETAKQTTSIYHAGAAWQTFEALKEVNRPEEIDWRYISSMQTVAWKTGTSYGFRDAWAIGVTPRYVVGVWVGNANGEGKPGLTGAKTAGPVLFDILNLLPYSKWFTPPFSELVEADICSASGHLKGPACEETKSIFICPSGLKTQICPYHQLINVTNDEQYRVFAHCAGKDGIKQKSWFVLPPAREWFYRQRHPSYRSLPPFKPGCGTDGFSQPMQFIYPQFGTRISIPRQLDGSEGQVVFNLAHSHRDVTVYWHLDDEYIGSTEHFHRMALSPNAGQHVVTVVDEEGNSLSIGFFVE